MLVNANSYRSFLKGQRRQEGLLLVNDTRLQVKGHQSSTRSEGFMPVYASLERVVLSLCVLHIIHIIISHVLHLDFK